MNSNESIERLKNTGRNDVCPCGSGKKYKKCHLFEDEAAQHESLKSAEAEREAVVAADAENETEDSEGKAAKSQGKNPKDNSGHQKGGQGRGTQTRSSSIPRRGAV